MNLNIGSGLKLFKKSFLKISLFEIFFALMAISVIYPLYSGLLKLSLNFCGIKYLTSSNLDRYVSSPTTELCLAIFFLIISILLWFDVAGCVFCFSRVHDEVKINIKEAISFSFNSVKEIFSKKQFGIFLYSAILFPFLGVWFVSTISGAFGIPEYAFRNREKLMISAVIFIFVAITLLQFWIFLAQNYFIVGYSFVSSAKQSRKLLKHSVIKTSIGFILCILIMAVLFIVISGCVTAIPAFLIQEFSGTKSRWAKNIFIILKILFRILSIAMGIYSIPMIFSYTSSLYYSKLETSKIKELPKIDYYHKKISAIPVIISIILTFSLDAGIIWSGAVSGVINIGLYKTAKISAHRGYSADAPENTLPAFQKAVEVGSDYIELDIQETKDSQIIVMHDKSLLRTTGMNEMVWDVNYNTIYHLDAGSWKAGQFKGTPVPTLESVLSYAKGKIKLNIEIKPTGHEVNIVPKTIDLINKYDMRKNCYITSFSYSILKQVKAYDSKIKTGYIMSVAYGNVAALKYADALSLKKSFVTTRLVGQCHASGKKVFAWTVDKSKDMQRMNDCNVDNIITDYPRRAIAANSRIYTGNTLISMYRYFAT